MIIISLDQPIQIQQDTFEREDSRGDRLSAYLRIEDYVNPVLFRISMSAEDLNALGDSDEERSGRLRAALSMWLTDGHVPEDDEVLDIVVERSGMSVSEIRLVKRRA